MPRNLGATVTADGPDDDLQRGSFAMKRGESAQGVQCVKLSILSLLSPCRSFALHFFASHHLVLWLLWCAVKRTAASRFNANNDCDNNGLRN